MITAYEKNEWTMPARSTVTAEFHRKALQKFCSPKFAATTGVDHSQYPDSERIYEVT